MSSSSEHGSCSKLPLREIPGSYGFPFFGAIKDRYDFHYNQGIETYFRSRMQTHQSTVYRANVPPGPFMAGDSKAVILVDAVSFQILFDNSRVDKTDFFDGNFMPSTDFFGGYRLCPFLDTAEPQHQTLKNFFLSTLAGLHNNFIPIFSLCMSQLFAKLEDGLEGKDGKSYFNDLSDETTFNFMFRLFSDNKDPTETPVGSNGTAYLNKWVFLQLAPLMTLGLKHLPNFLEDLALHTFPLPFFLMKSDYKKIYDAFYTSLGSILDEAEKVGIKRDEACHNFIFLAGFNAYGGMKVFFPSLIKWVGAAGEGLHGRLAAEIRAAVKQEGGVTLSALNKMSLTKSVVYETLRIEPPVPFQVGRAREDIVVDSHESAFLIKKGEVIYGYQPLATRDPKIFERGEEFVGDRFVGDGEKLVKYVYWSNGRETENATAADKQCPGKDLVVLLGRLMLVEFFLRYDTFSIEYGTILLGPSVTFTSVTKAT
nr:allene oxide synthase 3-like [Ipomoea trifida]